MIPMPYTPINSGKNPKVLRDEASMLLPDINSDTIINDFFVYPEYICENNRIGR